MAIGPIHLSWMRRLADRSCFDGLKSVIDLGPQDIQIERHILQDALAHRIPSAKLGAVLDKLYPSGRVAPDGQPDFYALFDLGPYASIDLDDARATYRLDLNQPISGIPEFDVVTNYGTTEHVFNIGEALRSIHTLTAPGGLSLHCVPCFAFVNHGFYTINPNVFVEMARANHYEIEDFSYFDNAFVRNVEMGRDGVLRFDLDSLPIRISDMEDTRKFMTKVVNRFHENLSAKNTRREISALGRNILPHRYPSEHFHICYVFDLIFFAMRRPQKRMPFVMPIQNASGVPPIAKPALSE